MNLDLYSNYVLYVQYTTHYCALGRDLPSRLTGRFTKGTLRVGKGAREILGAIHPRPPQ